MSALLTGGTPSRIERMNPAIWPAKFDPGSASSRLSTSRPSTSSNREKGESRRVARSPKITVLCDSRFPR